LEAATEVIVLSSAKKKSLILAAEETDRLVALSPFEPVEVEPELAEPMGAFREEAVDLEDFASLEPGVLDDLFGRGVFAEAGSLGGSWPRRG
jgi:hypothetical protein